MVRRRTSPGVQADADVDGPTGRRPDVRQHPQRGVGGACGVVLMGHRRAEQCQDAVAHDRADGAVEGVHGRRHGVDHRLQARDRDLGVDVGDQPRGTDGVREQQRHELACARHAQARSFPGAARGQCRSARGAVPIAGASECAPARAHVVQSGRCRPSGGTLCSAYTCVPSCHSTRFEPWGGRRESSIHTCSSGQHHPRRLVVDHGGMPTTRPLPEGMRWSRQSGDWRRL